MNRTTPSPRFVTALAGLVALGAALATIRPAHAGPTIGADLDLGTSIKRDTLYSGFNSGPMAGPERLYVVGFRIRAGWRFDLGPVWIVPELGAGYDRERIAAPTDPGVGLPRVFGGARVGISVPLAPALRFEPALFGHAGWTRYVRDTPADGLANDVGLSLDLRMLRLLTVGAHVGYEVVTSWVTPYAVTLTGAPAPSASVMLADRWVGYGLHAGVLF